MRPLAARWQSGTSDVGRRDAVLVAGSNTWGNYRHQADVLHSLHILRQNGFSQEQVILLHYDDIAYAEVRERLTVWASDG